MRRLIIRLHRGGYRGGYGGSSSDDGNKFRDLAESFTKEVLLDDEYGQAVFDTYDKIHDNLDSKKRLERKVEKIKSKMEKISDDSSKRKEYQELRSQLAKLSSGQYTINRGGELVKKKSPKAQKREDDIKAAEKELQKLSKGSKKDQDKKKLKDLQDTINKLKSGEYEIGRYGELKKVNAKSESKPPQSQPQSTPKPKSNDSKSPIPENEPTNPDEFRKWAHEYMKNIHKEDYDYRLTNQVVNGLLDTHNDNYQAMVGSLIYSGGRRKKKDK